MVGWDDNAGDQRGVAQRDPQGCRPAGRSVGVDGLQGAERRKDVGEATRVRVVHAAEQLAFSPNALAKGLIAQRSGTVGLLTSDLEGRFSIPILMGAEDAFGSDMTSVFLCDARGDAIREQHHLRALLSRRVDGLIVVGARPDVRPSLGHDLGVPVVYAYAPSDDPTDLSLVTDHYGGGELAVDHLLTYGRTRIGHISGDASYGAAQARARGAIDRLERDGLELAGGQVFFGAWSEAWGRNATRELLRRAPDIDAIFAGSDQIARGVLDTLDRAGVAVPAQVSVVGFDNWEALATNSRPALTTIDMNLQQLGRIAAQRLFAAIAGPPKSGVETLPCRLVARESSSPAD